MPVGETLERLLATMNAPPVDVLATVFGKWQEIVGPTLARHCKPASIDGATLIVEVSDAVWATELRWLASTVVGRLNEMCGSARFSALIVRVV